jgi:hypothetical protein
LFPPVEGPEPDGLLAVGGDMRKKIDLMGDYQEKQR